MSEQQKESDNNSGLAKPNTLPKMTWDEVVARAQRILDARGAPPYTPATFDSYVPNNLDKVLEDEAAVISEFVYYWLPYLRRKS